MLKSHMEKIDMDTLFKEPIKEGYKRCCKCKKIKSVDDFSKRNDTPDGKRYDCNDCKKKRSTRRRNEYPGRRRNDKLKQRYGITLDDYNKMLDNQEGRCAICGIHFSKLSRGLDVDHNHKINKVRALLCTNCNRGLGYFKDDSDILIKATNYLCQTQEK